MRLIVPMATIMLAASVAGCGDDGTPSSTDTRPRGTHAASYPGDVRSKDCASHWFTGDDETARFSCTAGGYRIEFLHPGQDATRTVIPAAGVLRVDAIVQTSSPGSSHLIADPGIGCYVDAEQGWLAQLGTKSVFVVIADGSSTPVERGTSDAVRPLSQRNRLVLTCDGSGSRTRISLRVNGTLVVDRAVVGKPAQFDRFGMWAAGEAGASVEVHSIAATTR